MPRAPLRRRQVNHPRPVLRASKRIPNSSPAKAELAQKLAHKPLGIRPTDSDDSDRLVVRGNGGRRGRYIPRQEIYASGAVADGDKPGNYPTRAQRRKNMNNVTKEIIADEQRELQKNGVSVSASPSQKRQQLMENSPLVNGHVNKPTAAKNIANSSPIAPSSIAKPPGSILRPVQATPARENSILGSLKPRRRQPSILQNLDHDSSSFDLEDEEKFLPDDESTPPNQPEAQCPIQTPSTSSPIVSSSRKRKFGASDPLDPTEHESVRNLTNSPLWAVREPQVSLEPSLPTIPSSALRDPGKKQREKIHDEDVMALPESSSSPAPTPAKNEAPIATKKSRKKASKPLPSMTTKELQATMMPSKRHPTARERRRNRGDFEIPADSDSEPEEASEEEDVSNFLPFKRGRKARRKEPVTKLSNKRARAKPGKGGKQNISSAAAAAAANKSKSSTSHLLTTTTAPILTPSTTASNRETKSPSQQSTTNTSSNTDPTLAKEGTQRRYGGSRRQNRDTATTAGGQDKENQHMDCSNIESCDNMLDLEATGSGADEGVIGKRPQKPPPLVKSKWAEIDAWDMDFEDVEVMTGSGSSSPTRR